VPQLAENLQLIGKNRQLMSISDNSSHQGAFSGAAKRDVASLFSEARAWSHPLCAGQGVRAVAENASLSSEATAPC
jgi:predicted NAD/FAD-binding protein